MQVPLQITYRGIDPSVALESRIRTKAARLDAFHDRITTCRVVVEERDRHKHQGKQFNVRLDVRVPGHEIVVDRDHHEDIYVALRDAFDAAVRQLEDTVRIDRGQVKAHPLERQGRVVRVFPEEGYGFIETAEGERYYFSRENVVEPEFDRLEPDAVVHFIEDAGAEGPQAKRVSVRRPRLQPE